MFQPILRIVALAAVCLAMAVPAVAQGGPGGPGPGPGPDQAQASAAWSGDVDQAATVYFHGTRSWVDNVRGKAVANIVSDFNGRLPIHHRVDVHLEDVHGRGDVRITQQPTADNNYTAAVRVRDPQPGSGHYHFRLVWNDNGNDNAPNNGNGPDNDHDNDNH